MLSARVGVLSKSSGALSRISVHSDNDDESGESFDLMENELEPLDANIYSLGVTSLIKDSVRFVKGTDALCIRGIRLATSLGLIAMCAAIQAFIIYSVYALLCRRATDDIRKLYSDYELTMYPNSTTTDEYGFHRGIPGHLQHDRFPLILDKDQDMICQIPLAHPRYFCTILFIWALTCALELRKIFETGNRLLFITPTIDTLRWTIEKAPGEKRVRVMGLTLVLKLLISCLIVLPRAGMLVALLWLGSRWLVSTPDLGEILLNALALEFVLTLPDLMYAVLVPRRSKLEVQNTLIMPLKTTEEVNCYSFFDSMFWGAGALAYVPLYVFIWQQVLPDYRWDVAAECMKHNHAMFT